METGLTRYLWGTSHKVISAIRDAYDELLGAMPPVPPATDPEPEEDAS